MGENSTNFDHLCSNLKLLKHEFSAIGLAETSIVIYLIKILIS